MLKIKFDEVLEEIDETYYEYLTNYLLFSNEFESMNDKHLLDKFIKDDYVYFLNNIIYNNQDENIYPKEIIERLDNLLKILEKRSKEILDEKEFEPLIELFIKMHESLTNLSYEHQNYVYEIEYLSKYSNMNEYYQITGIHLDELKLDIQKDFMYLNMLIEGIEVENPKEDYARFIRKFLSDCKNAVFIRKIYKGIMKNLSKSDDIECKKMYKMLKGKGKYEDIFSITVYKELSFAHFFSALIFSKNKKEMLNNTDPNYLFTSVASYCLATEFEILQKNQIISTEEKEAISELIIYMRSNIEYANEYKEEFIEIINSFITLLNTIRVVESDDLYIHFLRKIENKKVISYNENNEILKKAKVITCSDQINVLTKYFETNSEILKRELIEEKEITLIAIRIIIREFPNILYDDFIYNKINELLNELEDSKSLKKEIKKIRK